MSRSQEKSAARRARFVIVQKDGFSGTDVYSVYPAGAKFGEHGHPHVWVDVDANGRTRCRCTGCSGPLAAMKASCPHTAAVRRYLRKQVKP